MAVRCMFFVQEVTYAASDQGKVKLTATAKGPYAEWSQYTPSGTLEIVTLNAAATEWFKERLKKDVSILIDDPTEADLAPNA